MPCVFVHLVRLVNLFRNKTLEIHRPKGSVLCKPFCFICLFFLSKSFLKLHLIMLIRQHSVQEFLYNVISWKIKQTEISCKRIYLVQSYTNSQNFSEIYNIRMLFTKYLYFNYQYMHLKKMISHLLYREQWKFDIVIDTNDLFYIDFKIYQKHCKIPYKMSIRIVEHFVYIGRLANKS